MLIEVVNIIDVIAGLNVEQRKKLTIGVELASRPQLLLFLDEPSSGLDSQTSWSILDLLEKLTAHGQAILCTIHQPSATLLQRFDLMLFLGPNGKPVYFGELGLGCNTLTQYFEGNGAVSCPPEVNPAEYMMEITGCAPGTESEIDWPNVWRSSPEFAKVHQELEYMGRTLQKSETYVSSNESDYPEFAAPFVVQLWECFRRVNSQYWRSPTYIYSKIALCLLSVCSLGVAVECSNRFADIL
jgi:ATP-binding cassette subfamily G (WHITE) protein 2 (PDR)